MSDAAPATRTTAADDATGRSRHRASGRKQVRPSTDAASERIVLIEFLWRGPAGVQPVLYIDRAYLH